MLFSDKTKAGTGIALFKNQMTMELDWGEENDIEETEGENVQNAPNVFRRSMKQDFEMTNLGRMRYFLGIKVLQNSVGIAIFQKKYVQDIFKDNQHDGQ